MSALVLGTFGGPGGWPEGGRALGLLEVGLELDSAACATRRAAGHRTVQCDVAAFPVEQLAGKTWGQTHSPPCTTFSAAGDGAGNAVLELLAGLIRDMFARRDTRGECRRAMATALEAAQWPDPEMEPGKRTAKIGKAVISAALVAEPARYIVAGCPEWVAMEQVPSVLPLWEVYAGELRRTGFSTWTGKLNAADYGVPQTRERAILIASRVRRVSRPEPTHYDARKGLQLWGTPWVSMADALGWGATARPVPTVTAGGTATGGADPLARGGREALEAARDAGQWALRKDAQRNAALRPAPAPAPTISFGHAAGEMRWVLHTNRDQRPDGSRQTADPAAGPAPALTAKSGGQWVVRTSYGQPDIGPKKSGSGRGGSHEMDLELRPAHAITTKAKDWTLTRPATTVQGDPLVGRPGHKDRDKGERQFEQDSVRITVEEAAVLQSFPADYPFQGTKTAQFRQVGDAIPVLLAAHVLSMATGIPLAAEAGEAA